MSFGGPLDHLRDAIRAKPDTFDWVDFANAYFRGGNAKAQLLQWCADNRIMASFDYKEQGFTYEVIRSVYLQSLDGPGVWHPPALDPGPPG